MDPQDYDDADSDNLEDPILLNFEENALCLENLQFLDSGIIDLDCASDEDCKFVDDDTIVINLSGEDTSPEPVTSTDRVIVKPMNIKLVDCYKYPWYFDKPTKYIIESKIMDSKGFRIKEDECFKEIVDNNTNFSTSINKVSKQVIGINTNESINKTDKCVYEKNNGLLIKKVIDPTKRKSITEKKNNTELLKAISQRNNTKVDLKKNKGLVGMKIKRMPNEKLIENTKKERKKPLTLDKFYLQAVNETLLNINTTITSVFKEKSEYNKESGPNKSVSQVTNTDSSDKSFNTCITPVFKEKSEYNKESGPNESVSQVTKTDSSDKSFDSTCNLKLPLTLEDENYDKELKHNTVRRDINEEDMLTKFNKNKEVAKEIVKAITSYREEIFQNENIHKSYDVKWRQCKPMPLSMKRKNYHKKMHMKEQEATLKHEKNTERCKKTKMITSIPYSSKKRTKAKKVTNTGEAKKLKSLSLSSMPPKNYSDINCIVKSGSKEVVNNKHESGNGQTTKDFSAKHASPAHISGPSNVTKTFKEVNKFTKNILSIIRAKSRLQSNMAVSKIDNPDKLLKKPATKALDYVLHVESTDKCKTASSVSITTANVTEENGNAMKDVKLHARPLDEAKKVIPNINNIVSSEMSYSLLQFSNENTMNSPNPKESFLNKHLEFPTHIALKTSPLNTIIMETAKTDDAKINEGSSEFTENTQSNITNDNKTVKHSITDEQLASANSTGTKKSRKQSLKKIPLEERNVEDYMKDKGNSKSTQVAKSKPIKNDSQAAKDEHTIQTIITSRNELNVEKLDSQQRGNNITIVPKPQASAIIIKPTQTENHQTSEKNKPLTVPDSMQSHILYKPQEENQSPQMYPNNPEALRCMKQNQQPLDPILYPPLFMGTPVHAKLGVSTLMSDRTMPSGVKGAISPQTKINARLPVNGAKPMIPDSNKPISTQMGLADIPPGMNRGNAPHVGMNHRSISSGIIRPIPLQMRINQRHAGVSGNVLLQGTMDAKSMPALDEAPVFPQMGSYPRPRGVYKSNSPRMAMNDRSPRACHIQPGEVFWSYAFPPPNLPPPPPLPPFLQKTGFLFTEQVPDSSIIGRNNDGVIKKICLIANHNTLDTSTKEDIVKVVDMEINSSPIYDEVLESASAKTKSEMLQVLDTTSMHLIESPIKHTDDTISTSSNRSPSKNLKNVLPKAIDLKSSLFLRRNEKYDNKSKLELSELVDVPIKVNHTRNYTEITPDKSHNSMIDETLTIYKANQSPATNYTGITNFAQQLNYNRRPSDNYITNNESNVTQSKAPQRQIKEYSASHNNRNFEDNERTAISSKITGNASHLNLKRTLSTNKTNNSSTAGYKPGPLSKKIKFIDSSVSPNKTKTKSMGYTSPVLPMPTSEKIMFGKTAQKDLNIPVSKPFDKINVKTKKKAGNVSPSKLSRKRKQFEQARNKVYGSKKISLDEYKKRSFSERRTDERAKAFIYQKDTFQKNTVNVPRRASHVDSDLGYDSDATVKL